MRTCRSFAVCLLATLAVTGGVGAREAGAQQEPDAPARCRALSEAADRGDFDVAAAVRALNDKDEAVGRTAAAIVRHEWPQLPAALFLLLDGKPRAIERLLYELARAPRPCAVAWVERQSQPLEKRSLDHRLLALAARGTPLTGKEAALLLEALQRGEDDDGFHLAVPFVPEKVVDGLLGRVHQGLLQNQFAVERIAYLLDRLSPRGTKSLLGLVVTLPPAAARELCRRVYQNRPALVLERVAAALDGTLPLDALWLEFAGPVLDRPERVARVLQVLRDSDSPDERDRAFEALLDAKAVDEAMLAIAIDDDDDGHFAGEARILRVLHKAADDVPVARLVAWLQAWPRVAAATAKALTLRTELPPELQQALLVLLRETDVVDAGGALDALTAVVVGGDAAALTEVWPLMMGSRSWAMLLDRLGHRREPFVYERLLAALVSAPDRGDQDPLDEQQQQLDMVRLLLVGRGDRRELETLVQHAPSAEPLFLRRCRHYANPLPSKYVDVLVAAALAAEDPDVAAELLEWVASNPDAQVQERMWQLWRAPPDVPAAEELREIALRIVALGKQRPALLREWRTAVAAGPLPEHMTSLPYELLNSMQEPVTADGVRLCAEILLLPPLTDAATEQRRVRRWPDGSFGFPQAAAVAGRLRSADVAVAVKGFSAVVDKLVGDPRAARISRQRLKVFWRALAMVPDLQRALGSVTAQLWLFADGDRVVGDGSALWLLARAAEQRREFLRAAGLYRQATAALLRLPEARQEARWLLGDRYPGAGDDPWAALAAAPYRMRYLSARQAGDAVATAAAALLVREFAGHDRATLATLNDTHMESGR